MRLTVAIFILTLVAVGAGALAGLHLIATAERVVDARKNAAPANNWARVEASMVTDSLNDEEAGILAAHISEDIVIYLRSASAAQFEGARGLQHLRDDLTERANVRSSGKVRELIIETLVIQ